MSQLLQLFQLGFWAFWTMNLGRVIESTVQFHQNFIRNRIWNFLFSELHGLNIWTMGENIRLIRLICVHTSSMLYSHENLSVRLILKLVCWKYMQKRDEIFHNVQHPFQEPLLQQTNIMSSAENCISYCMSQQQLKRESFIKNSTRINSAQSVESLRYLKLSFQALKTLSVVSLKNTFSSFMLLNINAQYGEIQQQKPKFFFSPVKLTFNAQQWCKSIFSEACKKQQSKHFNKIYYFSLLRWSFLVRKCCNQVEHDFESFWLNLFSHKTLSCPFQASNQST